MKSEIVIEIKTKDKLMAKIEGDSKSVNIAKDFHKEVLDIVKKRLEGKMQEQDILEDVEEYAIDMQDNPKYYGLKIKIRRQRHSSQD